MQILSDLSKSKKLVPTSIEFVDIAGLVKGASTGEGLGNKFLANIRECDSIVQVSVYHEDTQQGLSHLAHSGTLQKHVNTKYHTDLMARAVP